MTYTCRSCSAETDNDSDVCDQFAAYCIICDGPCVCDPDPLAALSPTTQGDDV